MTRDLALALILALMLPAAAQAGVPHTLDGLTVRQERWAARTFVPLPEHVTVRQAPCPLIPSTSCAYGLPWVVYMHPDHDGEPGVFFHELGHEFDWQFLSIADRADWTRLRRRAAWSAELFASDYANCAVDLTHGRFHPAEAFFSYIGRRTHRRLCRRLLRWWVT